MIGLGLFDARDITLRGLDFLRKSKKVYLETYTSKLSCTIQDLEKEWGIHLREADRDTVEKKGDSIIAEAKDNDIAFLVIGDVFSATTHVDLLLRAKEQGVQVQVVPNASVLTAVGITGLELYKFGKTTSIVFPEANWKPQTPYDVLRDNLKTGYHTLLLLDIKTKEPTKEHLKEGKQVFQKPRYMSIPEAIEILFSIEKDRKENIFTHDTLCIGCARLGSPEPLVICGKASDLKNISFGEPLFCLIVPGKLHFLEEEALKYYRQSP